MPLIAVRPAAPPEPAAPAYQIEDVMDAAPEEIDALFGPPALTRREGEGEFRRYSLKQCELIVVLYPDEEGIRRAAHIDTAAQRSGVVKPDLIDCLAAG